MPLWYQITLYYLWIAPHLILAGTGVVMYSRNLQKKFPIFVIYTLYETLMFVLLLLNARTMSAPNHHSAYRYLYLVSMAGSAALRFGIIEEIFGDAFHGYARLEKLSKTSLRWMGGLLVIVAAAFVVFSAGSISDCLTAGVGLLARSVFIIQVGLLIFLLLFARLFGLPLRNFTFGLGLGFAIYASAETTLWALRLTEPDRHIKMLLGFLPTAAYHVSVLVWLKYLIADEKVVSTVTVPLPEIDKWRGELGHSQ